MLGVCGDPLGSRRVVTLARGASSFSSLGCWFILGLGLSLGRCWPRPLAVSLPVRPSALSSLSASLTSPGFSSFFFSTLSLPSYPLLLVVPIPWAGAPSSCSILVLRFIGPLGWRRFFKATNNNEVVGKSMSDQIFILFGWLPSRRFVCQTGWKTTSQGHVQPHKIL